MSRRILKPVRGSTAIFICDLQTRFKPAIHRFDRVCLTAAKVVKFAKLLDLPVVVTEQNPRVLGSIVPEIKLDTLGSLHLGTYPKTLFSMLTPDVLDVLRKHSDIKNILLLGIESHICVLQTALDLLERDYSVHVLADGVSSCNKEEVPIALDSLRQAGAQVTTSETVLYQLIVDAGGPDFKPFASAAKEEKENTKLALRSLLGHESEEHE